MKVTRNHQGFSAVEALLILIACGIVGFTGWYVWNSKNSSDKAFNSASASNNSAPSNSSIKTIDECKKASGSKIQETYPEVCVTSDGKKFTNTSAIQNGYLYFKELKMRIKLKQPEITDATYFYRSDNSGKFVYLSLKQFESVKALEGCTAKGGVDGTGSGIVVIAFNKPGDDNFGSPLTEADLKQTADKKLGDYYVSSLNNKYCPGPDPTQATKYDSLINKVQENFDQDINSLEIYSN